MFSILLTKASRLQMWNMSVGVSLHFKKESYVKTYFLFHCLSWPKDKLVDSDNLSDHFLFSPSLPRSHPSSFPPSLHPSLPPTMFLFIPLRFQLYYLFSSYAPKFLWKRNMLNWIKVWALRSDSLSLAGSCCHFWHIRPGLHYGYL